MRVSQFCKGHSRPARLKRMHATLTTSWSMERGQPRSPSRPPDEAGQGRPKAAQRGSLEGPVKLRGTLE